MCEITTLCKNSKIANVVFFGFNLVRARVSLNGAFCFFVRKFLSLETKRRFFISSMEVSESKEVLETQESQRFQSSSDISHPRCQTDSRVCVVIFNCKRTKQKEDT